MQYASVLIDAGTRNDFDYQIPTGMPVPIGARVSVPFGTKQVEGFVISIKQKTDVPPEKIKPIIRVMDDFAPIKPEFIAILPKLLCQK